MNRLTLASIAALAAVAPVSAADVATRPVYKAAPAMTSVHNWTGFYIGGNIGYSWGKADTDVTIPGFTAFSGVGTGIFEVDVPEARYSDSSKLKGIIGGGQLGYNTQTGPWVFGVEADLQASGEKSSATRVTPFDESFDIGVLSTSVSGTAITQHDAKIRWFGTVRGRLGYAMDGWLIYGTGGLAYGRVQVAGINAIEGVITDCIVAACTSTPFAASASFSRSKLNTGWTLGAGAEGALGNNWSWKLEYLYLDLGSLDVASSLPDFGTFAAHTHFTDHVVRAGLNYKFDWGKAPLVARY